MPLPRAMGAALAQLHPELLPGRLAGEGLSCAGARFHSPTPLLLHPTGLPDGREVDLCGTCKDNLGVLKTLLDQHGDELTWPVRREFGNQLRALLIPKETDG